MKFEDTEPDDDLPSGSVVPLDERRARVQQRVQEHLNQTQVRGSGNVSRDAKSAAGKAGPASGYHREYAADRQAKRLVEEGARVRHIAMGGELTVDATFGRGEDYELNIPRGDAFDAPGAQSSLMSHRSSRMSRGSSFGKDTDDDPRMALNQERESLGCSGQVTRHPGTGGWEITHSSPCAAHGVG